MDFDLSDDDSSTGDEGYDTPYESAMQVYNTTSNDSPLLLMLHPVSSDSQEFDQVYSSNNASAAASVSGSASSSKIKSILCKQPKVPKLPFKSGLSPGEPHCMIADKKFQLRTTDNQLLGFVHVATPQIIQADQRAQQQSPKQVNSALTKYFVSMACTQSALSDFQDSVQPIIFHCFDDISVPDSIDD